MDETVFKDVSIEGCDGTSYTFRMKADASVGALKEKLSHVTAVPRGALFLGSPIGICSDKSNIKDEADSNCFGSDEAVTFLAWGRRYSMRDEAASENARAVEHAEAQQRNAILADVRAFLHTVPMRTWALLVAWLIAGRIFKLLGFGTPQSIEPFDAPVWKQMLVLLAI